VAMEPAHEVYSNIATQVPFNHQTTKSMIYSDFNE